MDLPWKWINRKWTHFMSKLKDKKESKTNGYSSKSNSEINHNPQTSSSANTSEAELLNKFRVALKQKKISNLPQKVKLNPIEEIHSNEINTEDTENI